MSLYKFIKNKGEKIMRKQLEQNPEEAKKYLSSMGLPVDALDFTMESDERIAINGNVENQETREKVVLAIGNLFGISEVNDGLSVKSEQPQATFYTVKSGDSLSKIAKEQYGNAMKYPVIFEANKPMLKDPDKIYPGQVLRIPPLEN